jgi:carbonic anhydrase/acetyltransferase-like protein (isoleucine patch superfamily)
VEDDTLIGIGATVLNGARIGKGSVVAAGSLVPEGMQVPPSTLVMGVPAKAKRAVTAEEQARFREGVAHYVEKAKVYLEESR